MDGRDEVKKGQTDRIRLDAKRGIAAMTAEGKNTNGDDYPVYFQSVSRMYVCSM